MNRRVWMVIVIVGVLASAAGEAAMSHSEYMSVLRSSIKRNQVYSFENFNADIVWGVLSLTPRVREAIWDREGWITEKSAEANSVIIPVNKVRGTQFVLGLYAPKGTEQFDMTPDSFWTLKLDQGGAEYTPESIEPLENTPLVKRLIPFTHHWAKLYLVTFAGDFQKPFKLRMVGATAKGVISWR